MLNALAKKSHNRKDVGQVVYQCLFSKKVDSLQITKMINFQLIGLNIVRVKVDADRMKPLLHCKLCFNIDGDAQTNSTCTHLH